MPPSKKRGRRRSLNPAGINKRATPNKKEKSSRVEKSKTNTSTQTLINSYLPPLTRSKAAIQNELLKGVNDNFSTPSPSASPSLSSTPSRPDLSQNIRNDNADLILLQHSENLENPEKSLLYISSSVSTSTDESIPSIDKTLRLLMAKAGGACLICAHTLLLILERINSFGESLQKILQTTTWLSERHAEQESSRNLLGPSHKPPLETHVPPLRKTMRDVTRPAEQLPAKDLQLLWNPLAIGLSFPCNDSHWWTSKHLISQSLSCILNRAVYKTDIKNFYYLPTISGFKRLYVLFESRDLPRLLLRSKLKCEALLIRIQRVFIQSNLSWSCRNRKLFDSSHQQSCSAPTNTDTAAPTSVGTTKNLNRDYPSSVGKPKSGPITQNGITEENIATMVDKIFETAHLIW